MATALCTAALASPASAAWLPSQPLSAPDKPATAPLIALASDGRMVAAWLRSDGTQLRVEAAARPPGGALEAAQIVSEPGQQASQPQLALDGQGNALLMWQSGSTLKWATRAAGATGFGDPHTVLMPGNEQPGGFLLAVAPNGDAAALLRTSEPQGLDVRLRIRVLGGSPGEGFEFSPALEDALDDQDNQPQLDPVDISADGQGVFHATWRTTLMGIPPMTTTLKSAKGTAKPPAFGTPAVVASGMSDGPGGLVDTVVGFARAGLDAAGNLTVVYVVRRDDVNPYQSQLLIRSRPAGGDFIPGSEPVSPLNQENGPLEVGYDVNPGGTGVIAWRRGAAASATVEACVRPPGGPCGPAQTLASGTVFEPVAAIGAGGEAVAAWRRGIMSTSAVDGSFRPAGGGFSEARELGTGSSQVLVPQDGTDVDPLGHAVVGLDRIVGSTRTVEVAVNDSVAPSIGALAAPTLGNPGEALSFGAAVSDVWSPVASTWDFGDGSSAAGPAATHAYAGLGTFTATLNATDAVGNSATRSATVGIADTLEPRVLSFGMTRRVFAVGSTPTPLVARARGTAFRFALSEAATVRIAIQRALPGRRLRGRCRKPSARLRSRPRCTRWVRQGTLRRTARAGATRVRFSGRLGRSALHLGRHRAVLTAVDAAGNRSAPAQIGFRVVRR
jgi:hypothetical protein